MSEQNTNIVILGAGFGGMYAFKRLHKYFHNTNVKITLVNDHNYFLFTPLLHEVATGGVSPGNIVEPLRKIFDCCNVTFFVDKIEKVETKNKKVITKNHEIKYDYLILALGATTNYFGTKGAEEHTHSLKSLEDAISLKNHFIEVFERATTVHDEVELKKLLHFVVIGGGPTGVELSSEMCDLFFNTFKKYYSPHIFSHVKITILEKGDELLSRFPETIRRKSEQVLKKRNVSIRYGASVESIENDHIVLTNGEKIYARTKIWTAGVKPHEIVFDIELEKNFGKIVVDKHFRVKDAKNVFALGDMAQFMEKDAPLPALAQVATQQGRGVAEVLAGIIKEKHHTEFTYRHRGDLVSLGRFRAAGHIGKVFFYGRFAWGLWRTVYLSKMISKLKKLKVVIEWTAHLFSPRDISELYSFKDTGHAESK